MRDDTPKLIVGIGMRVLLSSVLGILITSFMIWPISDLFDIYHSKTNLSLLDASFSEFFLAGLMFFIFSVFFGAPLIIFAMIVASLLEETIERNILIWSIFTPVFVWLLVNVFVIGIKLIYGEDRSNIGGTLSVLVFSPLYLFFFGSMPVAILFYWSTKKFSENSISEHNTGA